VTGLQISRSIHTHHLATNCENSAILAAIEDWNLQSIDISHTYLNGEWTYQSIWNNLKVSHRETEKELSAYSISHYMGQNRVANSGTNDYTKC